MGTEDLPVTVDNAVGDERIIGDFRTAIDTGAGRPSQGQDGSVLDIPPVEFEELVAEALDEVPVELARLVDNVVIVVEEEPPADDPDLLGLYHGIPLTERGATYAGALPDRISIYRGPILRMCDTLDDVIDEVHITVVHEIAHHFGIDDDRLHELGYD